MRLPNTSSSVIARIITLESISGRHFSLQFFGLSPLSSSSFPSFSSSSSSFSPLLLIRAVGYVMRRYRQSPETGTQRPRKNATDSENRYQMKRLRAKCRSASEAASRRNRRKRNTENLIYGQAPRPSTDEIFWPQGVEGGARGECGRERRFGQPRI